MMPPCMMFILRFIIVYYIFYFYLVVQYYPHIFLMLLLLSLHLISSKGIKPLHLIGYCAFFPFILNGCLDIRPYCLLYFWFTMLFHAERKMMFLFKFSIINSWYYLFFIFMIHSLEGIMKQ